MLATPASLIAQAHMLVACVLREKEDSTAASSAAGSKVDTGTLAGAAHSCGRAAHTLAQSLPQLPATERGQDWSSPLGTAGLLTHLAARLCSQVARVLKQTELQDQER